MAVAMGRIVAIAAIRRSRVEPAEGGEGADSRGSAGARPGTGADPHPGAGPDRGSPGAAGPGRPAIPGESGSGGRRRLPARRGRLFRLRGGRDPGAVCRPPAVRPGGGGAGPRWTAPRRSWRKPGACCCGRSGPVSSAALRPRTGPLCSPRAARPSDELLAATERRYEAGEATALELNRARIAAAVRPGRAERGGSRGERGSRGAQGRCSAWRPERLSRRAGLWRRLPRQAWKRCWPVSTGGPTSARSPPSCARPRPRSCWARPWAGRSLGPAAVWRGRRARRS